MKKMGIEKHNSKPTKKVMSDRYRLIQEMRRRKTWNKE